MPRPGELVTLKREGSDHRPTVTFRAFEKFWSKRGYVIDHEGGGGDPGNMVVDPPTYADSSQLETVEDYEPMEGGE